MSDSPDNGRVNQLISQQRYEEAKAILRQSSDAASQKWLARLEELYPLRKDVVSEQSSAYGSYGLGVPQKYGRVSSSGSSSAARFATQYERGGCLTAFLIVVAAANVILTLAVFSMVQLIFCIFIVVCILGIWYQQKWGYFGLMCAYVLNILVSIFLLHSFSPAIGAVIGMTIAYALINPQLDSFA